jgi:hypothetical protein
MIPNDQLMNRIKRFHKRKSKDLQRMWTQGHSKEWVIWRALCALRTQTRIEKDNKRYLKFSDMVWVIAMKSFQDSFLMRDIKNYINYNFKLQTAARTAGNVRKRLEQAGYIRLENPQHPRSGYVLTTKARAFFIDLTELFTL